MPTKPDEQGSDVSSQSAAEPLPTTMKAVVRDRYGSADVLEFRDVERPTLARGDVLVRGRAAGLDRGDWHVMLGQPHLMRLAFGVQRPKDPRLGRSLAGVVEAVGADVTGWAPGTRCSASATARSPSTSRPVRGSSPGCRQI